MPMSMLQGVKGQAGFARTRQTGDHHQLVARDVNVDVFQVMGARTSHTNLAERTPSTEMVT
jgi:predicted RNA binding protein YcfA (HicA-like mRNA interferase family)